MEPISATAIAVKMGSLIFVGFSLSLGFWAGRRLTNRIDAYIYTHSSEYRKTLAQFAQTGTVVSAQ